MTHEVNRGWWLGREHTAPSLDIVHPVISIEVLNYSLTLNFELAEQTRVYFFLFGCAVVNALMSRPRRRCSVRESA